MHLETHALEDDFGSRRVRDLLQNCRDLRRVQALRGHENVELRRQQPQGGDIELASLKSEEVNINGRKVTLTYGNIPVA